MRTDPVPVFSPPGLRVLVLVMVALAGRPGPVAAQAPAPDVIKAAAALKPLRERMHAAGADPDRLRQDLHALRIAHLGTPASREAGRLLTQLPSPLDRLQATAIPELERFSWQPKELVAVFGEHRGRHGGFVQCVGYAGDDTVVSGGTGLVRLWNARTLRLRATRPYPGAVLCLAVSRDHHTLVVGGTTGIAQVWNITDKDKPELRFTLRLATTPVHAVALAPDGKTAVAGCADNTLHVHDIGGEKAKSLATFNSHTGVVAALAFAADGKTLASGGADQTVRLWSVRGADIKETATLEAGGIVTALAFTPRGDRLACGDITGVLRLWSLPAASRARPKVVVPTKAGLIGSLSFSKTGNTLAVAGADGTARLWTVVGTRPRERARLDGHGGPVFGVAYSPDNRTLITGSHDCTIRSWDLTGVRPTERFVPWSHLSHVFSVAFSPDGRTLASGSADRAVRLWDLTRSPLRTRTLLKGEPAAVYAVAYAPDGRTVAAGGETTTLLQWDAASGRALTPCKGLPGPVHAAAYLPDGRLLAMSGKVLLLWDMARGRELHRFEGHDTNLTCMALSPDGRRALSGSGIQLLENGKPVLRGGKYVYTDCVMRLWDVTGEKELQVVKSHKTPLSSLTFAADGLEAFSGATEAQVRRWELSGPSAVEQPGLKGGGGYAVSMLTTPDGRSLITLGLDGRLIVWDLATGERLHEWALPEFIGGLALAPDGRHLAVGLGTGVVYLLRLSEPNATGR